MHCQNALSVFFCSEEGNLRVKVSGLRQLSGRIFGLFHIYIYEGSTLPPPHITQTYLKNIPPTSPAEQKILRSKI